MRFSSATARMAHPQARLIPDLLWDNSALFDQTLPDTLLQVMRTKEHDLIVQLQRIAPELQSLQQKQCAWLAIALSHPKLSSGSLLNIARQLRMSHINLFKTAAMLDNDRFVNHLLSRYSPTTLRSMIAADDAAALRWTAANGHLKTLNRLITMIMKGNSLSVERNTAHKIQTMLAADNNAAFRWAVVNDHQPIINRLLHFYKVFDFAERDENVDVLTIHRFVDNQLALLHAQKTAMTQRNHAAVFDINDPNEAKLYFYILRNLIRRNDPALLNNIRFLLEIPAIKTLSYSTVTPETPHELLSLARAVGNQEATQLLVQIARAIRFQTTNHVPRNEEDHGGGLTRGGLTLQALVQDDESAMRALSRAEEHQLQAAFDHYGPLIAQAGADNIMAALRQELKTSYTLHPAKIIRDDHHTELTLPQHWQAFNALLLTPLEYNKALKAYYQNKAHTAWRLLSKPNPWIHPQAHYVYVSPDNTKRWAAFEDYQDLINMLYLAVIDTTIPAIDGYTLETRLERFIDELAYIGRAHNWDNHRIKTDVRGDNIRKTDGSFVIEEYDDLHADRPSCYSGMKTYFFQAVQGHPLLKIINKTTINEEIRDFVRQHFRDAINDQNRTALKLAWDDYLENLSDDSLAQLKTLDILERQQSQFIATLTEKYGAQFSEEPSFIRQIKEAFKFKTAEDAHILNFGHLHPEQLLEPPTSTAALNHTIFFAPARAQISCEIHAPSTIAPSIGIQY